jgi:hypothetical protein
MNLKTVEIFTSQRTKFIYSPTFELNVAIKAKKMTQEERLNVCTTCKNREFSIQQGLLCGLTHEKPTFDLTCSDFILDEIAKQNEDRTESKQIEERGSLIMISKFILFLIGFLFILMGYIESYLLPGHSITFGYIDWSISFIFFILGFYSLKHASRGLTIALIVFVGLNVLAFILEPSSILSAIIWKGVIFYVILRGIEPAKVEEARIKEMNAKS